VAVLVLSILAVYFYRPREICESEIHLNELNDLLWREGKTFYKRVAIGYNSCLDLIVVCWLCLIVMTSSPLERDVAAVAAHNAQPL
jgi:hypothetical protein